MRKMIIVRHRVIQWCLTVFIVIGELYGLEKLSTFLQYFPRSKDRKLDARIILGARVRGMLSKYRRLEDFRESSRGSNFLLTASREHSWILAKLTDCVQLLHYVLVMNLSSGSTQNPDVKNNFRAMLFFGAGIPTPTSFRIAELLKFSTFVDTKNIAFHSNFTETELDKLLELSSKPANRTFLNNYGLCIADVENMVHKLNEIRAGRL